VSPGGGGIKRQSASRGQEHRRLDRTARILVGGGSIGAWGKRKKGASQKACSGDVRKKKTTAGGRDVSRGNRSYAQGN